MITKETASEKSPIRLYMATADVKVIGFFDWSTQVSFHKTYQDALAWCQESRNKKVKNDKVESYTLNK